MAEPRKTVTALRPAGRERVAVDLDGERWRVLPLEAVHRAGLAEGTELDRAMLRTVWRELKRAEALSAALRSVRYRDYSRARLAQRLDRRGVAPAERERTLETLARAGVVDDERFANGRAAALAARGAGNLLIADDLERQGLARALIATALAGLEQETDRAARVMAQRGASARTLRFLAAKGFGPEALELAHEAVVAEAGENAIP